MSTIKTYPTPADLTAAFAADFSAWLNKLPDNRKVSVALSGGSTPKLLFGLWGTQYSESIDWNRIHFFWGDERCVPSEDEQSNFGVAKELWLDKVDIDPANIHRIRGEDNPHTERSRYEDEIRTHFTIGSNAIPCFDFIMLGMGADGHTASIFPHESQFLSSTRICEVASHPDSGQQRITLTGPVLNAALRVAFLITGADKSAVLKQVINKTGNYAAFPASHVAAKQVDYYLDEAAHA